MSRDQQAARVNVSDDEWIEFRTLAMRRRRSIADYLGELVRRELDGSKEPAKPSPAEKPQRPRRPSPPRVRLADQELLTGLPRETRAAAGGVVTLLPKPTDVPFPSRDHAMDRHER